MCTSRRQRATTAPLYDRNPQTFVPNVFLAQPADCRAATQRIYRGGEQASFLALPVVGCQSISVRDWGMMIEPLE